MSATSSMLGTTKTTCKAILGVLDKLIRVALMVTDKGTQLDEARYTKGWALSLCAWFLCQSTLRGI